MTDAVLSTPWCNWRIDVDENKVTAISPTRAQPTGHHALAPWFEAYLKGTPPTVPLDLLDLSPLPPFSRRVLEELSTLPFGTSISYGELAARVGNPKAARAVGSAMARNPFPLVIPCHRVLAATGIGGYSLGLEQKKKLLAHESV